MDVLGICANMVKALRYWLQTVGLTYEPAKGKRIQNFTELGKMVFEHDTYIEELGTLYLLQYCLASQKEEATAWYFFFNEFSMSEFSREDFVSSLQKYIKMRDSETDYAIRSLNEDFQCIINTYLPRYKLNPAKVSPENNIDCPFGELGLVDILNKRKKTYDLVDIRIVPLLKKGDLYKKLVGNKELKNILYKEDDSNNIKLNNDVIKVLKPFLFRPEKTCAKDDEYQLTQLLKDQGIEGEHLGWFKNLFKDEEQLHDTFKDLVEIIWDYLSDNRRTVFKKKDFTSNHKNNEDVEYTLFDELIEEFFNDEYDEETEYEYDSMILENQKPVLSFEDFLFETN